LSVEQVCQIIVCQGDMCNARHRTLELDTTSIQVCAYLETTESNVSAS
jgi:hypothetical protein